MHRFHRRTAPGVRNGLVRRTNNWWPSPSCYRYPQREPAVDRRRPGRGYRHLLGKRDVGRFVELLPHWAEVSAGLDVIVLDRGGQGCDGWYDRGVLAVCAWDVGMTGEHDSWWHAGHADVLARIGVPVAGGPDDPVAAWTRETARAYQLCHVFLHELGHHVDRMSTRSRTDNAPRGEGWAEDYALAHERAVWDRYCDEFGAPG